MEILEFLRGWASVLIFVLQALVAVVLWAIRKSLASKDDVGHLKTSIDKVDRRVHDLEQAGKEAPTSRELNSLRIEMEQMRGTMSTFAVQMKGERDRVVSDIAGVRAVFAAELDGARQALKATERVLGMVNEHLIATRK